MTVNEASHALITLELLPMLPLIIEPQDLEPMLDNPDLLIIDLCAPMNYNRAHIPGAIHVEPAELVSGVKPATGKLPSAQKLSRLFSRIGLFDAMHVVAYDDEGGGWAGRFLWTLEVIGHSSWSYLNGGLVAWMRERRPVTSQPSTPAASVVEVNICRDVIAEKETVLSALPNEQVVIWDARSAEEFSGDKRFATRGGHIPGAINLDWLDTMDRDQGLRIRHDIRQILQSHGITEDKQVITHCQTHHRSGLTWLIGKALNYNIKAYHGSWSEWGNDPNTPIEEGS
jgi:thiosulfate/3-mercaptopyruvate sulfurtransferase